MLPIADILSEKRQAMYCAHTSEAFLCCCGLYRTIFLVLLDPSSIVTCIILTTTILRAEYKPASQLTTAQATADQVPPNAGKLPFGERYGLKD